jgi:hypothetical protein
VLKVFVIYAHDDQRFRDEVGKHLSPLEGRCIEIWYDRAILPGADWDATIREKLEQANLFLLLVSSNLLASNYCRTVEFARAFERARLNDAVILPILLKPCLWEIEKFAPLQYVPREPITDFRNRSQAYFEIARGVQRIAGDYQAALTRQRQTVTGIDDWNPQVIPPALPYLCDRTWHLQLARGPMTLHVNAPRRGPFVLVLPGPRDEAHLQFVSRLEDELPTWLGMPDKPVRRMTPISLPLNSIRRDTLRRNVADSVRAALGAERLDEGVALVTASLPEPGWSSTQQRIAEAFLAFWDAWPSLPHSQAIIVCLMVEYARQVNRLPELGFLDFPNISGIVLPPLPPIEYLHVKDWLGQERVKKFYPPQKLKSLIDGVEEMFRDAPLQPMAVLAPKLAELLVRVNQLPVELSKAS